MLDLGDDGTEPLFAVRQVLISDIFWCKERTVDVLVLILPSITQGQLRRGDKKQNNRITPSIYKLDTCIAR